MPTLHLDGQWFKDPQGRTLGLRGVNLGGGSKVPTTPNGATHLREGFFEHRAVSFVGRPFPLEQADQHLRRLKRWGLSFLRWVVTWEAVEHAGAGIYDEAYLDYLRAVLQKAALHEFTVFIDPHQDVWGRLCGGDGAPGWTLEAVGFDPHGFKATQAAITHQEYDGAFPRMVWPTNYHRLAASTMFTLFFGGDDFAPATRIDGESAQAYLQNHYLGALRQIVERVQDIPAVVGYGTLNEPSHGYIGTVDLSKLQAGFKMHTMPTGFQSMLLGEGYAQEVEAWTVRPWGIFRTGSTRVDPAGRRAWQDGRGCVWRENGVWDVTRDGQPHLLRPGHFAQRDGQPVDFEGAYLRPFALKVKQAVRAIDPDALIFFEQDAFAQHTPDWSAEQAEGVVYAPHWYDGATLFTGTFRPWLGADNRTLRPVIGRGAVQRSFISQLADKLHEAQGIGGGVPTVIGETGIPFNLNSGTAFLTGDYRVQADALDMTMQAIEANLLNVTLWNYTPDNTHAHGDGWNGEDLSVFCSDEQIAPDDLDSGGRALDALVRPYARATAGTPVLQRFAYRTGAYQYRFMHDPALTDQPTEFYVPLQHYRDGVRVEVSDGAYDLDLPNQRLIYRHDPAHLTHSVRLWPAVPRPRQLRVPVWGLAVLGVLGLVGLARWLARRR
jgi:hypothetical protein